MSSSYTTEMTEQLVKDYANYAKVDWNNQASASFVTILISYCLRSYLITRVIMLMFQIKNVRDIIEDTLIRLEEFQSIVTMVSYESK